MPEGSHSLFPENFPWIIYLMVSSLFHPRLSFKCKNTCINSYFILLYFPFPILSFNFLMFPWVLASEFFLCVWTFYFCYHNVNFHGFLFAFWMFLSYNLQFKVLWNMLLFLWAMSYLLLWLCFCKIFSCLLSISLFAFSSIVMISVSHVSRYPHTDP